PVAGDLEGFGVVLVEAGAAGLPVVAADLEGIRDVVAANENGWLIPPEDAAAFEAEIVRFSERNDRAMLSARARRYVRAQFSWESIVEQYLVVLQDRIRGLHPEKPRDPPQDRQKPAQHLRD